MSVKTHLPMNGPLIALISCTFAYKTSQLHLKSHASSAQRKSSRTANLIFHRGHFSVVMSGPTLSIFHSARLRPIIWSLLPSVARSSSSMGKRAEIPYKWRKVKWGRAAIPSTYSGSQIKRNPVQKKKREKNLPKVRYWHHPSQMRGEALLN